MAMELLQEHRVSCPYCGESIPILVDTSQPGQDYIEDCAVCCKPITFVLQVHGESAIEISVYTENDVF